MATWMDLSPWSLTAPITLLKPLSIALATLAVVIGSVSAGAPGSFATMLAMLGLVALWKERRSKRRAAAEMLDGIRQDLRDGRGADDLHQRLERVLELDPDHDGARFLLACLLLERQQSLSALLQLAPLRDHHPDAGAVVLVAAAAYVNLSLHEDALRMLGVLEIDRKHPSLPAAAAIFHHCCATLGRPLDFGGLEPTSSQASS